MHGDVWHAIMHENTVVLRYVHTAPAEFECAIGRSMRRFRDLLRCSHGSGLLRKHCPCFLTWFDLVFFPCQQQCFSA